MPGGKICESLDCIKRASFGLKNGKRQFCREHKTPEMISKSLANKCNNIDCDLSKSFGLPDGKAEYCSTHKKTGMINLKKNTCVVENCSSVPCFDLPEGKGQYCKKHKKDGMIDVKHNTCIEKDCNTRPAFDNMGGEGKYCLEHKKEGMVDVISKRCKHTGCNTRPSFGKQNNKPEYCLQHKIEGMISLVGNICLEEDCEISASYGNNDKREYCKKHKKDGMTMSIKKCKNVDCKTTASYGYDTKKPLYCYGHKKEDMIDVINTRCQTKDCNSVNPSYGKPGCQRTHCAKHRQIGMIRRPRGKCKKCKNIALYGKNNTPNHCEIHKEHEEINLIEKSCIKCNLVMVLDKNNLCEYCNPISFKTNRLAKQNALISYLDSVNLKGISTDVTIENGLCGKERPDRVYESQLFILILECDENQHKDRQCSCEQTRMVNIGQAYGGLPVYFIRWNPDDYLPREEKKLVDTLQRRYKLLSDMIKSILNNKTVLPNALVSAIYMYYDGWSSLENEKWTIITPFETA